MDAIRAFVQTLLPFEFMQFDFMVNALLAILLLTPLLGLLGTMAVNQQMAFFSDALGHSALTGIGLGILLGVSSDLLAMLVFGIVWALLIAASSRPGQRPPIQSSASFRPRQWRRACWCCLWAVDSRSIRPCLSATCWQYRTATCSIC